MRFNKKSTKRMMCFKEELSNIKPYSLETKIHISLINSYAPKVHSFFLPAAQSHEASFACEEASARRGRPRSFAQARAVAFNARRSTSVEQFGVVMFVVSVMFTSVILRSQGPEVLAKHDSQSQI